MQKWTNSKWNDLFVIPMLLLIISGFFVSTNVFQHTQISPIDEYVYLDYTAQVFEVGILPQGSQTGDVARNYISCLGVAGYGDFNPEACNSGNYSEKDKYPYSGKSSADIYPPVYFWVAAAFANTLKTFAGIDFLAGARLSGIFWLGVSAVMLYYSLRKLQVPRITGFSASIILICSIPAWWSNTFISTDASALFVGSIGFYGLISFLQGSWKPWHLLLFSVVATLLKFQNIMVLGFLSLAIAISPTIKENYLEKYSFKHLKPKKAILTAIYILSSALITQMSFLLLRKVMAIGPIAQQGVIGELTIGAILSESTKFISGITWGSSSPETLPATAAVIATITSWIIIGGTVAASISERRIGFISFLGSIWILVAMISAPLLGIAIQFMAGPYFSLPARYGLSLLPIGLAISVITLGSNRYWRYLISAFAVFSTFVMLSGIVTQ